MSKSILTIFFSTIIICLNAQILKKPIPDKLVVLSFDDAVKSHYTNVAPLLKKYKFGATFFVCEFVTPPFSDTTKYMTWQQIGELNKMGFEIGNHTYHHTHVNKMKGEQMADELTYIENKCAEQNVKDKLISFAYPAYDTASRTFPILKEKGYLFARGGWSRAYDPLKDHPYLLPSFSTAGTDSTKVIQAIQQATNGKIVILTVHGVPDDAHPPVTTPLDLFNFYLKYLYDNHYKVIAIRDLKNYINVEKIITGELTLNQ